MNIEEFSKNQAESNYELIKDMFAETSENSITYANKIEGSYIYILISGDKNVLYVGETGASLYARIKGNGSGAHSSKEWFKEVQSVKYFKLPSDLYVRRKWENELTIVLKPKYQGSNLIK